MEKTKNSSTRKTLYIPEGQQAATPYLVVDGAARLMEFMKNAFNAKSTSVTRDDDNRIVHALLNIDGACIMVSDTMGMNTENAMLYLFVKDVDAVFEKAIDAGAKSLQPVKDQFYGDRAGAIQDEWGNKWWIATHREDLSAEELAKRAKQATKEMKNKPDTVNA